METVIQAIVSIIVLIGIRGCIAENPPFTIPELAAGSTPVGNPAGIDPTILDDILSAEARLCMAETADAGGRPAVATAPPTTTWSDIA